VAKLEWGSKRVCQGCGTKFYDMKRDPILCPGCGVQLDPETVLRARRAKPGAAPKAAKVVAVKEPDKEDDLDVVEKNGEKLLDDDDLTDDDLPDDNLDDDELADDGDLSDVVIVDNTEN
jgi:uncharacterized protein (TIGR02300 family)